jgi:phosphoglycolate phosphatase
MINLLIFDLDGTLADTGQDITNALNYALNPFHVREYSLDETKAMVGAGISKLLESLVPPGPPLPNGESGNPKEIVTARFLDYYDNHLIDNTAAYPFVKETLAELNGYTKAVLSNKREIYSKRVLEGLHIMEYFDCVLGSDSVREKKPSPVPILDLLEKYGVSKEEAVIIGDSNYDVEAGKAAGVKVIAVTYGFRKREVVQDADFIIDRFDELQKVIPMIDEGNNKVV